MKIVSLFVSSAFILTESVAAANPAAGSDVDADLRPMFVDFPDWVPVDFPPLPEIAIPDFLPTDCFENLADLAEDAVEVVAQCATIATGVPDLLVFGGDETDLRDVCVVLEDIVGCSDAVVDMAGQALDTARECADDFGLSANAIPGNPDIRLTNVLMNNVLCMENPLTDQLCIESIFHFVKDNLGSYANCIDDLFLDECSEECTALAREFNEQAGCCVTGIVYSTRAFQRLGVDASSVGHLTACGTEIFSCEPLQEVFMEAMDIELPPLAVTANGSLTIGNLGTPALVGILLCVALVITGALTLAYNLWWKKRRGGVSTKSHASIGATTSTWERHGEEETRAAAEMNRI